MTFASMSEKLAGRTAYGFGITGALCGLLSRRVQTPRILDTVVKSGVSIFDVAPSYGGGQAEKLAQRKLSGRENVFVMTKAGVQSTGIKTRKRDFSPAGIERSIEQSRRRLGRDTIDLLWLHGPDPIEVTPHLRDKMEEIRDRGWVHHFGLAGRGRKLLFAMDHSIFDAVMLPVFEGMDQYHYEVCKRARTQEKFIFGIETLTNAVGAGQGFSAGAVRRKLKRHSKKEPLEAGPKFQTTVDAALLWPLETRLADCVVSSTTLRKRVKHALSVLGDEKILSPVESSPKLAPVQKVDEVGVEEEADQVTNANRQAASLMPTPLHKIRDDLGMFSSLKVNKKI